MKKDNKKPEQPAPKAKSTGPDVGPKGPFAQHMDRLSLGSLRTGSSLPHLTSEMIVKVRQTYHDLTCFPHIMKELFA